MIGDPSLTALYLQNPAAAQALRRQQLGSQIAMGSMGGEPIQAHSQGMAKLAQALIGALMMRKADSELTEQAGESKKQQEEWSQMVRAMTSGAAPPMRESTPQQQGAMPAQMPPAMTPPGIHQNESGGSMQPGIYGDGGRAAGPMQVHAGALADVNRALGTNYTHEQLAANPAIGKQVGDAYYAQQLQRFGGDHAKAAAAYNAGPGRVQAAVGQHGEGWQQGIPDATRGYVQRALGAPGGAAPPQAAMSGDIEAEMHRARQMQAIAVQAANHPNPTIRAQAQMLMASANGAEQRAIAMMKFREGAQPASPERFQQQMQLAQAGRPSVENRVAVAGPSKAADLTAQRWDEMQTAVRKGNQADLQMQMFERAMSSFDPGVGADIRQSALQALQELGFKNNAPQAELMKSIQRRLEFANTPKGEGQITENERALIREATNLFGATPDGAKLLMAATRELNAYDRKVLGIMTESAKRNGGAPSPVEVAEALQQIPPALSPALEEQIRGRMQPATAGAPGVQPRAPTREEIEAELARRRAR